MLQPLCRIISSVRRRRSKGQVMVLGAVTMLLVALSLFMVLQVNWSVRERIRAQHAADAQAYSQAVLTARAFNYFAFTNRAIAGALVSMTMLHAYHSEISAESDVYWWLALHHFGAVGVEFALGCCVSTPFGCIRCSCPSHCKHALEDLKTATKFFSKRKKIAQEVQATDGPFRNAINGFAVMIRALRGSQYAVYADLNSKIGLDGRIDLRVGGENVNIPGGTDASPAGLRALTIGKVLGSLDLGTGIKKERDMTQVVNSARNNWTAKRGFQTAAVLAPLTSKIQGMGGGYWGVRQAPGMGHAALAKGKKSSPPASGQAGDTLGADDFWIATGACKHGCVPGSLLGIYSGGGRGVYTNKAGGAHKKEIFEKPHSGGDHRLDVSGLLGFVGLKVKSDPPYGQPAVYGFASKDARTNEKGTVLPWNITSNGLFSAAIQGNQKTLRFGAQRPVKAISKAMVYYHRPGNWREPPNMWNPYWRAKLEPFGKTEAVAALGAAGEGEAAAVAAIGINTK